MFVYDSVELILWVNDIHTYHEYLYRKQVAVRIQKDLSDFKLKINMGLGGFFGDQQVHGK